MILFKQMNDSEINLFWDPQAFLSPAGNRTAWQDNSLHEQRCTLVAVLYVKVSLLIEFVCQKRNSANEELALHNNISSPYCNFEIKCLMFWEKNLEFPFFFFFVNSISHLNQLNKI